MTKHDIARSAINNVDPPRSRCFLRQDLFLTGILIGIGVLIVVSVALFLSRAGEVTYVDESTPEGVVQNYIVALYQQDFQRAYGYLAEQTGKPAYQQFVAAMMNPAMMSDQSMRIDGVSIEDDWAYVRIALVYTGDPFSGGWENTDVARLVRQDGAWKIVYLPYPYWMWEWNPVPVPEEKTP